MDELKNCIDDGRKIEVADLHTYFLCDGNVINLYSVSEEDMPIFIERYKKQKEMLDNLTPEQKANREAQLQKSIAGTGKKVLDKVRGLW